MTLHVCSPKTVWLRSVRPRPTCKRRRRVIGMEQLWYGVIWTCLGCGEQWGDGEILPRPFKRGWRAESISWARERWAEAPSRPEANVQMRELFEMELGCAG